MAKLIGTDIAPQDLHAKITGRAKFAEDFRVDGMVFAKLLLSPMPHARVRSIETARALALPGVLGILTADEVPQPELPGEAQLVAERHGERLVREHVHAALLAVHGEREQALRGALEHGGPEQPGRSPEQISHRRGGGSGRDHALDEGAPGERALQDLGGLHLVHSDGSSR